MNPVEIARSLIGVSAYEFMVEGCSPPATINCSVLVEYAFMKCGIRMPKNLYAQLYRGESLPEDETVRDGDLIFATAKWGSYLDKTRAVDGIGHNGILTSAGTVIHAAFKVGVVEISEKKFLYGREYRRRYRIPELQVAD